MPAPRQKRTRKSSLQAEAEDVRPSGEIARESLAGQGRGARREIGLTEAGRPAGQTLALIATRRVSKDRWLRLQFDSVATPTAKPKPLLTQQAGDGVLQSQPAA
ncbi:hypothetical protein [Aureliella helgolandensis]|uniref:Uncharacterized protein n=1 Tax=Aureliella helgolandensis TaxID=2527968 RepID=A0A518G4K7_9BACT|nr:hypothetical protein [Aureliella helgolandensis]QDV23537.1 hypothetical protein Q31a_18380 [Aureliella helgolandensis]